MLNRANRFPSNRDLIIEECENLRNIFVRLKYPNNLISAGITTFSSKVVRFKEQNTLTQNKEKTVRIVIPFKDQKSANVLRKQLKNLSLIIGNANIVPVFTSAKIEKDLKHREVKPSVVNNQCVVYHFKCDLCDTEYIGYTTRHASP